MFLENLPENLLENGKKLPAPCVLQTTVICKYNNITIYTKIYFHDNELSYNRKSIGSRIFVHFIKFPESGPGPNAS